MSNALIYISAAVFLIAIFPIHIYNYIYLNTGKKYASINAGAFKWNFFNANTVENNPFEMQVNGKNKKIDAKKFQASFYRVFDKLCIYKIVQLSDFGVKNQNNAYVALAQNAFTVAIYKFIQMNGNYCKLRNYTVFNEEHSEIRYYAKAVTILNLIVVAKIFFIIITEKIHERKT